jgi:hypothetical protein
MDINQRLESVTMSVAQSESEEIGDSDGLTDSGTGTGRREGSIGDLVATQRKLLEECNLLISHIQSLPGFQNFLRPPSFDVLSSATAHGPIIIINQSPFRSYLILLLHFGNARPGRPKRQRVQARRTARPHPYTPAAFTRGGTQDFGQIYIPFTSTIIPISPHLKVILARFEHKCDKVRIPVLRGPCFIPCPLSSHCLSPLYPYLAPEHFPKPLKAFHVLFTILSFSLPL